MNDATPPTPPPPPDFTPATPAERAALKSISEKFLYGDLLKIIMDEIRQQSVPWGALPEKEQQKVIDRVTERTEKTVREVVRIIASKTRPTVQADVESVTFKDGVKVTLTFSKAAADRHAIADSAGRNVLLVLPDYESALGGDVPIADKDQPGLNL
jgi:hypothetical protein